MKERLLELLTKLGYSATRLADEIGVQRSGISHILSGRNQPSFEFLVKILKRFPDINAEWILLGMGKMFKSNPEIENVLLKSAADNAMHGNDLFVKPSMNEAIKPTQKSIEKVTDVTTVKRIILLNSDGTFDVYHHSGNI